MGNWAPEGLPIPVQRAWLQDLAPQGGGSSPQGRPGAGGKCWKDMAAKARGPLPGPSQPQPQIRLTASRSSAPPGFSVLRLLPGSADQRPRPVPSRLATPRSCVAPPPEPRSWRGRSLKAWPASRARGGAGLRRAPPQLWVGGAAGARARRRRPHAEDLDSRGGPRRRPLRSQPPAARGARRRRRRRHVSVPAGLLWLPGPARHRAGHHGDGAPHGRARQRRGRARLPGARPR